MAERASGQAQAPLLEDRVDLLVVGGAAGGAVARAARGDALRLVTADERAAGVAGLGAHVDAGEPVDRALGIVDRLVAGLDGAAVPAGGRARAADRRADRRLLRTVDGHRAAGVVVHRPGRVPSGVGLDIGHVAAGEDRAAERAAAAVGA